MSYFEEDFYNEPSEFDIQVDEFKQSLLKSVKAEFVSEMERLRNENAELQKVKKRMREIESERKREKSELEEVKRKASSEAKKQRLGDLLKDFKVTIYKCKSEYNLIPKCDKCDESRKVQYITPLGRVMKEDCTCAKKSVAYFVKEIESAAIEHWDAQHGVKVKYYDDDRDEVIRSYQMYEKGSEYKDIVSWTYFADREDCQSYCGWMTEQERIKEDA